MSTKIVLIGAGSAMFGLGAVGDILKSKSLAGSTIVLNDTNLEALAFVEGITKRYVEEHTLPYTIKAVANLDESLVGAQFCVVSIEVGDRHELWEQDWKIPMQYGFKQVYGENGGPGGLFHALRIIPPILNICERITQICPEAYVINLSNPMVRIMHAIHTKFPKLKTVGICHEVASLIEHLPPLLGTSLDNLSIKAGGFNHFSVLVEAKYKDSGKDAYPDIKEKGPAYFAKAPAVFGYVGERGLFQEILKRFGSLPVTTDSHLANTFLGLRVSSTIGEFWNFTAATGRKCFRTGRRHYAALRKARRKPNIGASSTSSKELWAIRVIMSWRSIYPTMASSNICRATRLSRFQPQLTRTASMGLSSTLTPRHSPGYS